MNKKPDYVGGNDLAGHAHFCVVDTARGIIYNGVDNVVVLEPGDAASKRKAHDAFIQAMGSCDVILQIYAQAGV